MAKDAKNVKTESVKTQAEPAKEPTWCLICSAKPATGRLRRVFLRERVAVPVAAEAVPVLVCRDCGKAQDNRLVESIDGRRVVWEYSAG